MLHSGIDLHKRTIVVSTVTADGQPVRDASLPTSRDAVRAYFATMPGPHRAVVESTSTWYWLRDLLASEGIDLRLGHSKYIKAISYAKVKTDAVDAATLAQLLRSELIPEAHVVSAEWREARDLLRARLQLVVQQVRCKNTLEGLLEQYNVAAPAALPPLVQLRTTMLAEQRALLGAQAKRLADALTPRLIPTPDVQRLVCVPGSGGSSPSRSSSRSRLQPRRGAAVARALVAKELARIVYSILSKQEAFNGTFKGKPLSRTKTPKWPRAGPLPGEPARLTGAAFLGRRGSPPHLIGAPGAAPSRDLWDRSRDREPAMVCGRH